MDTSAFEEKKLKIMALLPKIKVQCKEAHVALIDEESAVLIGRFLQDISCRRLLEIGSGYGYSALVFWLSMLQNNYEADNEIVTIERLQNRWEVANAFFQEAGVSPSIRCILGEAPDAFACVDFSQKWDCVFVDAAMGRYTDFWFQLKDFVTPGGIFVADNINLHEVLDVEAKELPRRHRTMQKRLLAFLELVDNDSEWQCQRFSYGEGILIAQKRRNEKQIKNTEQSRNKGVGEDC